MYKKRINLGLWYERIRTTVCTQPMFVKKALINLHQTLRVLAQRD